MIKYRLRFKYQKESEIEKDRENNLNEILSDIDSIESDTPIRKPIDGEIIVVSGQEYKVVETTISFEKDGDVTYYDFVVLLARNVKPPRVVKSSIPKSTGISIDDWRKIVEDEIAKTKSEEKYKYKKYIDTRPDKNFNI